MKTFSIQVENINVIEAIKAILVLDPKARIIDANEELDSSYSILSEFEGKEDYKSIKDGMDKALNAYSLGDMSQFSELGDGWYKK